jgi:hypothetical protein
MRRGLAGLAGTACVLCVVAGCSGAAVDRAGQDQVHGPQPREGAPAWPGRPGVTVGDEPSTWWPVSSVRDLVPTGIDVVAGSRIHGMVVDGAGAIWVDVPWGLVRLDPVTFSATTWNAADDAAFADKRFVRASHASGVWVVGRDQIRLFDGARLVRDIRVPSAYLGQVLENGQRRPDLEGIRDVVEVGSELWIVTAAGVARCDGYTWSMVGEGQPDGVEKVQLTPWGDVWAGSWTTWGEFRWARHDAGAWTPIDPGNASAAEAIAWDPTGGIVAASGSEVWRFDGSSWRNLLRLDTADEEDPVEVEAVAASSDGTVWALTREGLMRSTGEADWRTISSWDSLTGVAVSGLDVVVSADAGVYRVDGDELELVWSARGRSALLADFVGAVTVSEDEAWMVAADWDREADLFYLYELRAGRLHPVLTRNLQAREAGTHLGWSSTRLGVATVVASDGAIWYVTDESVVRIVDGTETVVAGRPPGAGLLSGDDGAVWLLPMARMPGWFVGPEDVQPNDDADWEGLCLLTADGACTASELPAPARDIRSVLAGPDDHLWATICPAGVAPGGWGIPTCPGGWQLMRRDGGWIPVAYPGADVTALGASPAGGLWAVLADTTGQEEWEVLAHYRSGRWTTFPEFAGTALDAYGYYDVEVTPAGSVCRIDPVGPELVCVDTQSRITRTPFPMVGGLAVAAGGTIWVWASDGLARLPITAPD